MTLHTNHYEEIKALRIEEFDYPLPDARIAKHPLAAREQCKLLHWHTDGTIDDRHFYDVPSLLPPQSLLIYNNTRVINARLRFTKATGSTIEIFCLEPVMPRDYALMFQSVGHCVWQCLVGNSKRWKEGALTQQVAVGDRQVTVHATRGERDGNAWHIAFDWDSDDTWATVLEAMGEIPIPPYLNRGTEESDSTDYQTVYSHIDGSVAAPTAGLHFTPELLAECDDRGIARRELTLHVGAGTFQPVKSEVIGEHAMHHELIEVPRDLIAELATTSRPVTAVGTTSVRTLESLYYVGLQLHHGIADDDETRLTVPQWMPYTATCDLDTRQALQAIVDHLDAHGLDTLVCSTQLMIAPGFRYRIVQRIITNFHQPQSTLLLLVAAAVGQERWRVIYDHALESDYRFLSYGDACLIEVEPYTQSPQ